MSLLLILNILLFQTGVSIVDFEQINADLDSTQQTIIYRKGKTPTQVFSCKFCEIFEKTYFEEHLRTVVSVYLQLSLL